ncbi:MAG TPA: glycosyltransferase [Rhizobiales bacterium]|nr:glycosyltransferase [Hyphomicrobiales bacterium]
MISIVIPTLNAGPGLAATLHSLVGAAIDGLVSELIVSDGGSGDETLAIADEAGAIIVTGEKGRGGQLRRGAKQARSDWLLFLHGDTVLEPGWADEARRFMDGGGQKAAVFRFGVDDRRWRARLLEKIVLMRCRLFALPYGDQGLLISRALYDEIGGFGDLVLMEDVDIIRRCGRARLHFFASRAITSAERYRRDGYVRRMMKNGRCLAMWFAGVAPEKIAEKYR